MKTHRIIPALATLGLLPFLFPSLHVQAQETSSKAKTAAQAAKGAYDNRELIGAAVSGDSVKIEKAVAAKLIEEGQNGIAQVIYGACPWWSAFASDAQQQKTALAYARILGEQQGISVLQASNDDLGSDVARPNALQQAGFSQDSIDRINSLVNNMNAHPDTADNCKNQIQHILSSEPTALSNLCPPGSMSSMVDKPSITVNKPCKPCCKKPCKH